MEGILELAEGFYFCMYPFLTKNNLHKTVKENLIGKG